MLPFWAEVCDLACRTAAASPVRAVGWDNAVTPGGPCLIEGNI